MSNDLTKVYQFLSSYTQGDKNWVDTADKNADGIVIKAEFTEFLNAEYKNWSGNESGETLDADIINKFWKSIDTTVSGKVSGSSKSNRNALDKTEQANLDKKLEVYVALNEFISSNVSIPTVLTTTGTQWKAAVCDELSAILENNKSKGVKELEKLWKEELPAIENKQTALFCATEYQNTLMSGILKDYPDYKVADDSTLNKLIDNYLKTITGESDESTIKSDIEEIMKSYLATAGLGEDGSYDLSTLGYEIKDGDKLNGIQEAVAKASVKKNLEGIKSDPNYEKYKEYYDKAIEEFLNAEIGKATAGTFETVKAIGLESFKKSDSYKGIQNRIAFDVLFDNSEISDTNKLYKALESRFGKTIAESIIKDGAYMSAYTKITAAAFEKVNSGEFLKADKTIDIDAILKYVTDEIGKNLSAFTDGIFGDMTLAELRELYQKISTNASKMDDTTAALNTKRKAAIDYCNTIAAKSESLKEAVIKAFGNTNYVSIINTLYPSKIDAAMTKLFTLVEEAEKKDATAKQKEEILKNISSADKQKEVTDYINNTYAPNAKPTFYVGKNGEIVFVKYAAEGGAFNDEENTTLKNSFDKLKAQLEKTYSDTLKSLELKTSEKTNLFNIALYMTLSDTSVVRSMYEVQDPKIIMENVLKNYIKLLEKVSSDEKTRNYVQTYPNGSLLAGTSTYGSNWKELHDSYETSKKHLSKNLNKYYLDDSTSGKDDWVRIDSREIVTYTDGKYSGSIQLLNGSCAGDNNPINAGMKSMLKDYITSYSKYIDGNRIIELFRQAQETAFANLEASIDPNEPSGSSIYGYGDGGKKGNYDTTNGEYRGANSILINIAYEMEKLIAREMAGLN